MKKGMNMLAILGFVLVAAACNKHSIKPSGPVTNQTYLLGNYDKVVISDAIQADITFVTGQESVVVEANANMHDYVIAELQGGTLYIGLKDKVIFTGAYTVKIHIRTQDFNALDISGASTCSFNNDWAANVQDICVSGASQLSCGLNSSSANISVSGASTADFWGTTQSVSLDASGASHIGGFSWVCEDLKADLSGGSDVDLSVNGTLRLDLSGASTLRYMGSGSIVEIQTSGGSSVVHL